MRASLLPLVCVLAILVVACQEERVTPVGPEGDPPSDAAEVLERLDDAQEEQERAQEELRQLTAGELVELLRADSEADLEPFNSRAFREIERRGESIGEELAEVVGAEVRPSFLSVLALRAVNAPAYRQLEQQVVTTVLVETLADAMYFNAWGLPHLYWEDAALATIEQGDLALDALTELLEDSRPAPVYGSEEVVESELYGYRVRDYAFALIGEIRQIEIELPVDPAERDELIGELLVG